MELKLLDPRTDLEEIEAIWSTLSGACRASYFLSWGWMESWIRSLHEGAGVKLVAGFVHGTPALAFFVGYTKIVRRRMFTSRALFLNATGMDPYDRLCIEYNGILCRDTLRLDEVLRAIPIEWDEFYMPGLDPRLIPGGSISGIFHPWKVVVDADADSPYVDLDMVRKQDGGYLSLLSGNTRKKVKRAYRAYADHGPIRLEVAADAATALHIFDELVELHQSAWKAKGEPGAFSSDYFSGFHRNIIEARLPAGEIQLLRIKAGGSTLGCFYNFVYDKHVYCYQGGLNYADGKRFRPGYVCDAEAIRYNAEQGNRIYDFLAGDSEYKRSMSTNESRLVWIKIQKPSLSFWLEDRLRGIKRSGHRLVGKSTT